jgi:hypothetical protein
LSTSPGLPGGQDLAANQQPDSGGGTMTRLSFLASLSALALFAAGLSAAENPQIGALRNQIKALKAQEGPMVKAIEAHYDSLIHRDKMSEKELEELRHKIHEQEEAMLAHATNEAERKAIHERFDGMRHLLSKDVHMDAGQINKLKEMRHEHVEHVKRQIHAKIHELEEQIKALEHQKKK